MKKQLTLTGACGLLCLLFAIPAMAQITNTVNFSTTFTFYAGNTKMPAGAYKIMPSSYNDSVLLIESAVGNHSGFVDFLPTQASSAHKMTDVTFKKYGNVEFLNLIWVGGQTYGMQVEQSKYEKKLSENGEPQTHSVPGK